MYALTLAFGFGCGFLFGFLSPSPSPVGGGGGGGMPGCSDGRLSLDLCLAGTDGTTWLGAG